MKETTLDGLIREIRKAYDRMYAGGSEADLRASMAYCRGVIKALETQAAVDADEEFALRLAGRIDDRIDTLKNNAAANDKLNRRPVSTTKRGFIKCSGKWASHKIAATRYINLQIANAAAMCGCTRYSDGSWEWHTFGGQPGERSEKATKTLDAIDGTEAQRRQQGTTR